MSNNFATFPSGPILDSRGRVARYLRVSVTDRCNLHCLYCRNQEKDRYIPHEKILRFEHFTRLISIARKLGIGKIRVTGGEPFVRADCMPFISSLRARFPDLRLSVTTNATLLDPWLRDLSRANLASVNISIDSFERETYRHLTGADLLPAVLANMDRLLALGQRVKINVVAIRGITDTQIDDFLHASRSLPVDIRFIEFMPMGNGTIWSQDKFISCEELRRLIASRARIVPSDKGPERLFSGPASMYSMENAPGRLGFIAALSGHFCENCNRLRVTSEGRLRVCLFADKEYDLAPMLKRNNVSDQAIGRSIMGACLRKPMGSTILARSEKIAVATKKMTGIGG